MTTLPPQPDSEPEAPSGPRPRVLLVDDNGDGRRAMGKLLEANGFDITECATGDAALNALREGPPFDFVLTDLMLPDLDGREIASFAAQLRPTPFIALITGWSLDAEPIDPASEGVDHVFLKPIRMDELVATMLAYRPRSGVGTGGESHPGA